MTTIAFTRPERRLEESLRVAESLGLSAVCAPSLDIVQGDAEDFARVRKALEDGRYGIAVFCSPTAVEECVDVWKDDTASLFEGVRCVPIGTSTKASLESAGIETFDLPEVYSSEGIVGYAGANGIRDPTIVIHSDHGSPALIDGLNALDIDTDELIAYRLSMHSGDGRTETMREMGLRGEIDWFLFTSRMSVGSFFEAMGDDSARLLKGARIGAIGAPTAGELAARGFAPDVVPEEYTFRCLLESVISFDLHHQ
ncbi:MAG: uroporphyrinogen-III synthase [Candidatus Methanomethylophilaceae archaeon]